MTDPQEQRQIVTGSIPSSGKSKDEKGMAQSSAHPVRPGKKDCQSYIQTVRCDYRRICHFNHPPHLRHEFREKTNAPVCKLFLRGVCKKDSSCLFRHIKDRDGSEPMPQSTSQRPNESRQEFEDICQRRDEKASGFKRPRIPVNPNVNAQENLQEQRQGNSKRQRREAQENMQQQRFMKEMQENHNVYAHNQLNPEEHRKRELEWQRMEAHLRVDQELQQRTNAPVCKFFLRGKCKKGSDFLFRHIKNRDGSQPMRQEMPWNHNVDAHNQQNPEEQRKIETERQRTEARLRLDQMRPTALFNESSRPKEVVKEFGLKDFKGV